MPPGQGGMQQGGGFPPSGQQSICMEFPAIRQAAEQSAAQIRAAGERKMPRDQVCNLFKSFAAQEAKMLKFLVDNKTTCGIPPQAITSVRGNHAKTLELRKNVCSAGPAMLGPSLSDALGGPIIADDTSSKQPGRGTFDTLTGNVLSR